MDLTPFLPRTLRTLLRERAEDVLAPASTSTEAVVLLADVSGFTRLAERLARAGPAGAEVLRSVLDRCFGELLRRVADHGGDVLKFAGDALLIAFFAAEAHALAPAARRAIGCALSLQRALDGPPQPGVEALSLRIASAAGTLHLSSIGATPGRRDLLPFGPVLQELSAARAGLHPREIGLGPSLQRLLGDDVRAEVRDGIHLVKALLTRERPHRVPPDTEPDRDPALVQSHVPTLLQGAHARALGTFVGELRRVTVAFIQLPAWSSSAPRDTYVGDADRRFELAAAVAARFEGSVNKVSADEKGAVMLLCWGLPGCTHEDDAARAVRACLRLAEDYGRIGATASMGVASGRVYCGLIGAPERAEYTVLGDAVNLAARLMDRAMGRIWVDERCQLLCRGEVEFERLDPFHAKGKSLPIEVFRAVRTGARAPRETVAVVGRDVELSAIDALLDACVHGEGGTLALEGAAGLGKSRLVAEARERAADRSILCLIGGGDAIEADTAGYGLRTVAATYFGLDPEDQSDNARARVEEHLAQRPCPADRMALLAPLLPFTVHDTPWSAALPRELKADHCAGVLADLLDAAARLRPILLVIEDAHWLDPLSARVLQRLHRDAKSVGVLLTTRPVDRLSPEVGALIAHSTTIHLRLGALRRADVAALLALRLGVDEIPEPVVDLLEARAEGNPLFAEELALTLCDSGALVVDGRRCVTGLGPSELETLALPDSVQAVVASRLDRIDAGQQWTLKVASVIGPSFGVPILADIHPDQGSQEHLVLELDHLEARGFVRLVGAGTEQSYAFRHSLTHAAIYDLMLYAQRRELHHRAAEWIERHHAEDLEQHFPLLAHHWTRAEAWSRAVSALERAGEQALSRFANSAAVRFFTDASDIDRRERLESGRERRARWHRGAAIASYGSGDLAGCTRHATLALQLQGWSTPTTAFGRAFALVGQLALRALQVALPGVFAAHDADSRTRRMDAVRLQTLHSESFLYAQDAVGMLFSGIRELNMAEPAGRSAELGRAYATMAAILGTVPLTALAERCVRNAEENARDADSLDRAFIFTRASVFGIYGAQWARCERWLAEARAESFRFEHWKQWIDSTTILGQVQQYRGDFLGMLETYGAQHTTAVRVGHEQGVTWGRLGQGTALARLGRLDEALEHLGAVERWAREQASGPESIWAIGMLAVARFDAGAEEDGLSLAELALARIEAGRPTAYWTLGGTMAVASIHLRRVRRSGLKPGRVEELRRASAALRRFAKVFPFGDAAASLYEGFLAQAEGRDGGVALRRAATLAEERGQGYEAAIGWSELARVGHEGAAERASQWCARIGITEASLRYA